MKSPTLFATVVSLGVLGSGIAAADDVYCPGYDFSMKDKIRYNIIVYDGTCELDGKKVKGNITVKEDGVLEATYVKVKGNVFVEEYGEFYGTNVKIKGNLEAEGAKTVELDEMNDGKSKVVGDVKLKYLMEDSARIEGVDIYGNVELEENYGVVNVLRNYIKGNVQAYKNHGMVNIEDNNMDEMGKIGGDVQAFENYMVKIEDNWIEGNLQCKDNNEVTAENNWVGGNKEDQCDPYYKP